MRAVILEDEENTLKGLITLIPWTDLEVEIVGTARDGISGLELIRSVSPDLVLTDIKMPGITGLEVIGQARKFLPRTDYVIFTGYQDFDFAQEAIVLGAFDFILKPLTPKKILATLDRLRTQKIQSDDLLLVEGNSATGSQLEGLILNAARVGGSLTLAGSSAEDTFSVLVATPGVPVASLPRPLQLLHLFKVEDHDVAVVRNPGNQITPNEIEKALAPLPSREPEKWVDLRMGIGIFYKNLRKVRRSYQNALSAYRYCTASENKRVVNGEDVVFQSSFPDEIDLIENGILLAIRMGNREEMLRELDRFIEIIDTPEISNDQHFSLCVELGFLAGRAIREFGLDLGTFNLEPLDQLQTDYQREKSAQWLRDKVEHQMDRVSTFQHTRSPAKMQKVLEFIENHLDHDLSLEKVADKIGLNKNYLSILFKENTGISFVKHVTNLRIERSKNLLRKGFYVYQVSAMVGYDNDRYFCAVFKKATGLTPKVFLAKSGIDPDQS